MIGLRGNIVHVDICSTFEVTSPLLFQSRKPTANLEYKTPSRRLDSGSPTTLSLSLASTVIAIRSSSR